MVTDVIGGKIDCARVLNAGDLDSPTCILHLYTPHQNSGHLETETVQAAAVKIC